jgi:predicted RecA/RadA family phage recombinase
MKNYVQDGETITLPAPYAVASGDGLLVGAIFGVAANAAANGANVETKINGVFELTTLSTDTATAGTKAYWDNTNKRVTTTASGNSLIGVFTVAKTNGQTTSFVRLNGISI